MKPSKAPRKEVTLEDVLPAHPTEYPAKGLKARLDRRRSELHRIHDHAHSEGLETDEWVDSDA